MGAERNSPTYANTVICDPVGGPNGKEEMDQQRSPTESCAQLYSEFESLGLLSNKEKQKTEKGKYHKRRTETLLFLHHQQQCKRFFCRQHAPAASRRFHCQPLLPPPLVFPNHFCGRIPCPRSLSICLVLLLLSVPPSLVNHGSFPSPQVLLLKSLRLSLLRMRNQRRQNSSRYCPVVLNYSIAKSNCISRVPENGIVVVQVAKRLEKTARYFKRLGSLGFWGQLVCTVVAAVILSFSVVITGKVTSPATFYATAGGIVAAFISVFWSFGYIRLSEKLRKTANDPSKVCLCAF